jgi:hypothetical protein
MPIRCIALSSSIKPVEAARIAPMHALASAGKSPADPDRKLHPIIAEAAGNTAPSCLVAEIATLQGTVQGLQTGIFFS